MTAIMLATPLSAKAGLAVKCADGSFYTFGKSGPKHSGLHGALVGKSGGVILSRRIGDDQLELRGQDAESYWNERCDRSESNPAQFVCVGSGGEFDSGKAFELQSTLTVNCPITVDWIVKRDGKTTRSGRDELTELKNPKSEPVPSRP